MLLSFGPRSCGPAGLGVLPARSQDGQLSRQQQFAQDLLEELVEIDITHSSGSTTMAAQGPAEKGPG